MTKPPKERPSFQFYAGDWRSNAKLRRCSHAERGIWLEVLCLMHDSERYGVLDWPLNDIAQAVGCKVYELQSLVRKQVMKGSESGKVDAFIFTPRHAGKDGDPVILIAEQSGPIWYSSRMVRDEYIRTKRGESSRFGEEPKPPPNGSPNPPIGDGPSVFSLQSSGTTTTPNGVGAEGAADDPWLIGKDFLMSRGMSKRDAGSFIGKCVKHHGKPETVKAVQAAMDVQSPKPEEYIWAVLQKRPKPRKFDPVAFNARTV